MPEPPLVSAIKNLNQEEAIRLIRAGANPNESDYYYYYRTPLIAAIQTMVTEDVSIPDKSPIMMPIIEELLKAGADPNLEDGYNTTPLSASIVYQREFPDLVKFLLEAGADPNAQDNKRTTALFIAANHGNLMAIKTLLEHPGIQNLPIAYVLGKTVLQLAKERYFKKSVNELILKMPSYMQRRAVKKMTDDTTTGPFSEHDPHVFNRVLNFIGPNKLGGGGRRRKTRRVKKAKKTMRRKTYNYRK